MRTYLKYGDVMCNQAFNNLFKEKLESIQGTIHKVCTLKF